MSPAIPLANEDILHNLNAKYVVAASFVAWALYRFYVYPVYLSPLRKIPGPPFKPFVGQAKAYETEEPGTPFVRWIKEYGPIVRTQGLLGQERIVFESPEALHKILTEDWADFPRPKFLRNLLGTVAGYGLLTVTGDVHRRMRKAMNPAFSLTNLTMHMDIFYEITESLVAIMNKQIEASPDPNGTVIPIYEWVSKATLDMICMASFGYETDSLHDDNNELASAYEQLMELQNGRSMILAAIFFSIPGFSALINSDFGYRIRHVFSFMPVVSRLSSLIDSMYRIRVISAQMMKEKVQEAATFGLSDVQSKKDIMSILIRERAAGKQRIDGEEAMNDTAMMAQVLTFLSAGHDTTASSITWTLWLLSKHPEYQQKLREEVQPIFEVNSRPEYRELKELPYLDGVVMESLRLMPAAPVTVRVAQKTDVIDGVVIPKGTEIMVPIRAVNSNKRTWGEDAEDFKPSRWESLPAGHQNSMEFLSFITGPHGCIGKTMSIMEMKTAVAALISNFHFEPTHAGQVPKPIGAITMKPQDNMPLRVRKAAQKKSFI